MDCFVKYLAAGTGSGQSNTSKRMLLLHRINKCKYLYFSTLNRRVYLILTEQFSQSIDKGCKPFLCSCPSNALNQRRKFIPYSLVSKSGKAKVLPGQGLKKLNPKELKKIEDESAVLRFINKRIKEQERGKKIFSFLPDFKFLFLLSIFGYVCIIFVWTFLYPDIKTIVLHTYDEPSFYDNVIREKSNSPVARLYMKLPLRFVSRYTGRLLEMQYPSFLREFMAKTYCTLTGAVPEEALETDLSKYKSIGEFFRRPINPEFRPIDQKANVVSPADGKVLVFGKVNNGMVEQVKGFNYSLRKFLGPTAIPDADAGEKTSLKSRKSLTNYHRSLMRDPDKNELYNCVIYLAPGDYHGFHSPSNWNVTKRRHYAGELLSVNPKIAAWVRSLFVLNERVVLSGTWKHGFFSMTAVGATNVGSIKIHGDLLLDTNQLIWKTGSAYDFDIEGEGRKLEKGDPVGEFNLGSSVVLIFEAPKNFKFNLETGQKLKYGQKICSQED